MNTIKKTKISSLYIHIPFCDSICPYCDFTKFISKDFFKSKYVSQLLKDLLSLYKKGNRFKTIYIGGGTPTCLKINDLRRLLKVLKLLLNKNDYEFTIEANPESIDEEKLKLFKSCGINRISIGIQTFNKDLLKSINRDYGINYFDLIKLVKKYISNINVDLIYGLPGQTISTLKDDLENFVQLDINHISAYSLSINPMSIFYVNKVKEIDDDLSRKYYDLILKFLRAHGFERYEISNFAKDGFESRHNLTYWRNNQSIGIGCGASGYEYPYRYKISSSLTEYLKGKRKRDKEIVYKKDDLEYFLICNLRLKEGFDLREFKKQFGFDFVKKYKNIINQYINSGFLVVNKYQIYCSDEGLIKLDFLLRDLI